MVQSETLLASVADGVMTLTLDRPDKLNSFNEESASRPSHRGGKRA